MALFLAPARRIRAALCRRIIPSRWMREDPRGLRRNGYRTRRV